MLMIILLFTFSAVVVSQEPVNELIVDKYYGRWFQAYASTYVMDGTQLGGVCVLADYNKRPDGNIGVFNSMRVLVPDGLPANISGIAYPTNRTGVLIVRLEGTGRDSNYWVYKLGPKTYGIEERYEYAIVSEPTKLNLYVLVRNLTDFFERFDDEVREFLEDNGYNTAENPYVETLHNDECIYTKRREIIPVDKLDLSKYVGRWYQTYISEYTFNATQLLSTCATATYGALPDGTVSVFNSQNLGSPGGPQVSISGIAFPTNRTGVLKVYLAGIPRLGDYWVIKLGPETFGPSNFYEYAVVSEPSKFNLFVLVRDVEDFYARFDEEVKEFLNEEGFNDPKNPYVKMYQGNDCVYPPF